MLDWMNLKEISSSADFYQLKEYTLTSKLIIFPFFLAFFDQISTLL